MKIKFLYDNLRDVPPEVLASINCQVSDQLLASFDKGAEYTVYGLSFSSEGLMFLIEPANCSFPLWGPNALFEIIDHRVSQYWVLGEYERYTGEIAHMMVFPEFLEDDFHLHVIEEDNEEIITKYDQIKKILNKEFEIE